ncbi:hypothetical protein JAAARDRAFT_35292 [Jaapia argillacea MUCL 33604]|uniref:Inhibitor I9 domain-containing protein n=1 Tax=Jaapia argillacea MUCL 33604 TaxID=933084 RepID=A0A067Q4S4_9AGAM|nr:hypothetical protein JAAARDRAFT_35292 [Jaapia argillacea MUCL 33604]
MSGMYIVVFKDYVTNDQILDAVAGVRSAGGQIREVYTSVLKGFSATIPDSYFSQLQSLVGGPIDYIEEDQVLSIF